MGTEIKDAKKLPGAPTPGATRPPGLEMYAAGGGGGLLAKGGGSQSQPTIGKKSNCSEVERSPLEEARESSYYLKIIFFRGGALGKRISRRRSSWLCLGRDNSVPARRPAYNAPWRICARAFARSWKRAGCSWETYCVDAPGGAEGRARPARERASERRAFRKAPGLERRSGSPLASWCWVSGLWGQPQQKDPEAEASRRLAAAAPSHPENPGVKLTTACRGVQQTEDHRTFRGLRGSSPTHHSGALGFPEPPPQIQHGRD
ncbi:uncharacterized protein LOC122204000 [Panthera leo]|uniref:uncharacterized protein LOC122204000 n=1 Tax=Panthera leo TaxID=9689 RepID=UPI001C6A145B|nr:uncharacterized protein LOC122204000 [Panthera leo]